MSNMLIQCLIAHSNIELNISTSNKTLNQTLNETLNDIFKCFYRFLNMLSSNLQTVFKNINPIKNKKKLKIISTKIKNSIKK